MFGDFDINFVIFGVMPYVALTVFLVGSIARYERDPFTWKSSSSQLLRKKQLIWGSILFHVGILTVFFGHLVGLFTPVWVLDALGVPYGLKQWLAVLIGGPAGLAALIGGTMLIHRRLTDPRIRATSTTLDILILLLIWLQLAIGLLTITQSLQHMDGAEMIRFMEWSQSVVTWNVNAWVISFTRDAVSASMPVVSMANEVVVSAMPVANPRKMTIRSACAVARGSRLIAS